MRKAILVRIQADFRCVTEVVFPCIMVKHYKCFIDMLVLKTQQIVKYLVGVWSPTLVQGKNVGKL